MPATKAQPDLPPPYQASSPRVPSSTEQLEDVRLEVSNHQTEQRSDQDIEQGSYDDSLLRRLVKKQRLLHAMAAVFMFCAAALVLTLVVAMIVREERGDDDDDGK